MKKTFLTQVVGIKKSTDFISLVKHKTTVRSIWGENGNIGAIVSNLTIKDLQKLVKLAKKRHKECLKYRNYYVHISPDLSILMKGNKK